METGRGASAWPRRGARLERRTRGSFRVERVVLPPPMEETYADRLAPHRRRAVRGRLERVEPAAQERDYRVDLPPRRRLLSSVSARAFASLGQDVERRGERGGDDLWTKVVVGCIEVLGDRRGDQLLELEASRARRWLRSVSSLSMQTASARRGRLSSYSCSERMNFAHRLERVLALRPLGERLRERFLHERKVAEEDVFLAREVGEDRPRRDVGCLRDLRQGRVVVAALGEELARRGRSSRASAASCARVGRVARSSALSIRVNPALRRIFALRAALRLFSASSCKFAKREDSRPDWSSPMLKLTRWTIAHRRIVVVGWIVLADRHPRRLAGGRQAEREQLLASEHRLAARGRPAPKPFSGAGRRRRPDRLPDAHRQAHRRVDARGDRRRCSCASPGSPTSQASSALYDAGADAVSKAGTIGFATVEFDQRANQLPKAAIDRVINTAEAVRSPALQVELGGQAIKQAQQTSLGFATGVGLVAAVVVLLLSFGSAARDGPADRDSAVRPRRRAGRDRAREPSRRHGRLLLRARADDRPRRRHRLRALHRHALPRRLPRERRQRPALRSSWR